MSYQPKVYREQGGDKMIVASGGELEIQAGGAITNDAIPKAANFTLTAADSGGVFLITAADVVATLPATVLGLHYTFIVKTASATTGFSVSPVAADSINGGTDDKDLINTAATDAVGDSVTIHGDGSVGWYTSSKVGTWAAEA